MHVVSYVQTHNKFMIYFNKYYKYKYIVDFKKYPTKLTTRQYFFSVSR